MMDAVAALNKLVDLTAVEVNIHRATGELLARAVMPAIPQAVPLTPTELADRVADQAQRMNARVVRERDEREAGTDLVPREARDVVDVGCAAGRLGAALKARQSCRVVGVEQNPAAATAARTRLDLVVEWDAEHLDWPFPPHSFDAVICGDVLEHLRDPLAFLRQVRTWLRPTGVLVASLPNVRHHSVVRGLLAGDWTYEPAGLLDHTHLRFFTRREIEKLLHRAGFDVSRLVPVPGPGYAEWVATGCGRGRGLTDCPHRAGRSRGVLHPPVAGRGPCRPAEGLRPHVDCHPHPQPASVHTGLSQQHSPPDGRGLRTGAGR
jgi:2-polyprenyl-3-methyl-5-hydroxy-6-metoxy-1,4-benzoquinol methylase